MQGGEVDGDSGVDSSELPAKKKSRSSRDAAAIKRRCVSTACIACRRRKSKCDGNTPSCAACSSVYRTGESCTGRIMTKADVSAQNAYTTQTAIIDGKAYTKRRSTA